MLHLQEAIPLQGVIHGVQVPERLNIQNQVSKYNSTCARTVSRPRKARQYDEEVLQCHVEVGGPIVSVLDSRLSCPGFSPGQEHCVTTPVLKGI